ncbi:BMP family lipoprotein [Nocardioides sp. T2.26MG-1]|uniref:BMP family lipoprotein n=1 Tax=Nocardioides sp. T2.26MG-1 TaxID=3041166 RepID=UPI0024773AAD|nr:BMP family ABC transporter substrate-binding protein [Nocardioides sp. T2.26MG-1]CAI9405396.1 Membrane lipoprotein TmpC [Nocardioides sp. T2.26MG-1]
MNNLRKAVCGSVAALLSASILTACGSEPEDKAGDKPSAGGESSATAPDFKPCIVSDAGGFDDKSFNQLSYEGAKQAADELGVKLTAVESNSENDYAPNLESLVAEGCDSIVTVGFALSAATVESAKANPDIIYILIDDAADNDFNGEKDAENVKPLLYDTAQAAFLAGYAAADYTKTGVVGTYGGQPYPTVTIFMDGFKQGAEYYSKEKGKEVKVVGFEGGDKGVFTGGFEANEKATNTATQLLDQDVDVILPVGGPIYQGALTAIDSTGKDVALIGVDADFFETDPNTQDVVLTSILKNMKVSTYEAIMAASTSVSDGSEFDFSPYIGTLENDGVGIAPFHNFESKVSDSLAGELDTVKAGIIDGSIKVDSYLK